MLQKKSKNIGLLSVILFFILCYLLLANFARAQNSGITVSPSIIQLDLGKNPPQATLTYTNHTDSTIELYFEAKDSPLENVFGIENSSSNFHYGLSSWVSFSNKTLVVSPNQTGQITVFVNKNELSPGGHYGYILARINQNTQSQNITIQAVLSTLLFVRSHTGKEYDQAVISTFAPEQSFFSFPQNFLLRLNDTGNTFLTPYGKVDIYGPFGDLIARGILNQGSVMVIPESLRRFEIPIVTFTSFLFPGIYSYKFSIHYAEDSLHQSVSGSFFSLGNIPIIQIIILFLILIGIFYISKRKGSN